MPTTSMMTRKWSLCLPQQSTPSRRSSRWMTLTFTFLAVTFETFWLWYFIKGLLCFKMLPNIFGTTLQNVCYLCPEKQWGLWNDILLAGQHQPTPALSETIQRWRGESINSIKGLKVGSDTVHNLFFFPPGIYDSEHKQTERTLPEELWPDGVQTGAEWPFHPDLSAAHQGGWRNHTAHDRSVPLDTGPSPFWSFRPEPLASKS